MGSLIRSLLPSRAALMIGDDCFLTHLLLYLTDESVFKVALLTKRGVGEYRDTPAIQTSCCCCCFPGPRANSADGIIHTATWMHLDGTAPQAVRRAVGYLRFPKEFPEHAAGEGDTPPFLFFFFFFFYLCVPLCSLSAAFHILPKPPCSSLFFSFIAVFPQTGDKRQDCLLKTLIGHQRGINCALDEWRIPVVGRVIASWRWQTNPDAHTCVEKHVEFPVYKCFLFHARFVYARGICVTSVTHNSALLQEAELH